HVAALEVALVHPVVGAGDLERALRVADDDVLLGDLRFEEELLDALFVVDLEEALLRARALVLHGVAVPVAEADLEELAHAMQIAPMDPTDSDLARRAHRERRRLGLGHGPPRIPPPRPFGLSAAAPPRTSEVRGAWTRCRCARRDG